MYCEHHDLASEFPDLERLIKTMRAENEEFARLAKEHDSLDDKINTLENRDIPVADHYFEELKKRRLQLKDQLYGMLNSHQQG